jgi:antitoxin component YwqK of YwqJK toxin-antitoxin module
MHTMVVSTSDPCVQAHCRDGAWDGEWKELYRDGGAAAEGAYARGLRVGTWRRWGPAGSLLGTVEMVDGNGHWRDWHDNGATAEEGEFVDGEQAGHWRWWSPDGGLVQEADFIHGVRDGQSRWFDEDGGVLKSEWYVYGRLADAGTPHPRFVPRLVPSGEVGHCGPGGARSTASAAR